MANHLKPEKLNQVMHSLVEGVSVRSTERMTGVHRDTILKHLVRIGNGCANLLNETMVDLTCRRLELDELWAFIQKKNRHMTDEDPRSYGDTWTWVAFDSETKLVPTFMTGKRNEVAANAFIADLEARLRDKVQLSTDGLKMYVPAIGAAFLPKKGVDYASIIKTYEPEAAGPGRYSPPKVTGTVRTPIFGQPRKDWVSTSGVERNNLNVRMGVRRFTRLTNAFSKKLENHGAAVSLWFAYYNLVRVHGTVETTPAVAAGVSKHEWKLAELIEAASAKADAV